MAAPTVPGMDSAVMEPTGPPKPVFRPRPIMSVATAFTVRDKVFRYSACSAEQRWTGTVEAESVESAVLDVIRRVRKESSVERLRFLVQVPPRSTLWALRDEIALLIPGVCVERPRLSDEELVRAAMAGLRVVALAPPPAA